jgi:Ser/Thr protein kinase RdoA (MazF antagonist)
MNAVVEKALALWGMQGAQYSLVAARENSVFQITTATNRFALRLHRQGYRTNQELWSELKWMEAVKLGGISVPTPIVSESGEVLHVLEGVQVDVLTWLTGVTMEETFKTHSIAERAALFRQLGQKMAKLHSISDNWQRPSDFSRCAWDRDGLLGEAPLWGRFWDNPALSACDRQLFLKIREKANAELANIETSLDYGLIHADLVNANVMVDGKHTHLIDFDDGGFGFRLFEIATVLQKNIGSHDYPTLRAALIEGYLSVRDIDLKVLNLFILLRSATYVGWNISRMHEDKSGVRNDRFIAATRLQAEEYLAN